MTKTSKLKVDQIVRLKKTAAAYPGHKAIVKHIRPGTDLVYLGVLAKDGVTHIAGLHFLSTAIKNPNIERGVRYVITTGGIFTREEQDSAETFGNGIRIARDIWKAGDFQDRVDLWRDRVTKSGEKKTRLLTTFHSKNDEQEELV